VACLPGLTEEDMRENTLMIKKKVRAYSTGQMEENTKEDGKMENNTVSEHIHQLVGKQSKANGKKVKDSIG